MSDLLLVIRVPRPTRVAYIVATAILALVLMHAGTVLDPHAAGKAAIGIEAVYEPDAALASLCWAGAGACAMLILCLLRHGGRTPVRAGGRSALRVVQDDDRGSP